MIFYCWITCGGCGKSHRIHRNLASGFRYHFHCKRCGAEVIFSVNSVQWLYEPNNRNANPGLPDTSKVIRAQMVEEKKQLSRKELRAYQSRIDSQMQIKTQPRVNVSNVKRLSKEKDALEIDPRTLKRTSSK